MTYEEAQMLAAQIAAVFEKAQTVCVERRSIAWNGDPHSWVVIVIHPGKEEM